MPACKNRQYFSWGDRKSATSRILLSSLSNYCQWWCFQVKMSCCGISPLPGQNSKDNFLLLGLTLWLRATTNVPKLIFAHTLNKSISALSTYMKVYYCMLNSISPLVFNLIQNWQKSFKSAISGIKKRQSFFILQNPRFWRFFSNTKNPQPLLLVFTPL